MQSNWADEIIENLFCGSIQDSHASGYGPKEDLVSALRKAYADGMKNGYQMCVIGRGYDDLDEEAKALERGKA